MRRPEGTPKTPRSDLRQQPRVAIPGTARVIILGRPVRRIHRVVVVSVKARRRVARQRCGRGVGGGRAARGVWAVLGNKRSWEFVGSLSQLQRQTRDAHVGYLRRQ